METDQLPESSNIEDRRGQGGGFGGLPGGRGGLGIGTIVVLGLIGWALGIDPRLLIGGAELIEGGGGGDQYQAPAQNGTTGVPQDKSGQFVSRILGSTEIEWKDIFTKGGATPATSAMTGLGWATIACIKREQRPMISAK